MNETGEAIDARARVVARAQSFIGEQDPNVFFREAAPQFADRGDEHKIAWCGIFALACLRLEGLTKILWETGKGFVSHLRVTHEPEAGDVAVFGAPLWHHAIVERVENGRVHTIDGNVLHFPHEGVAACDRPLGPNVTFYSIAGLIS